MNIQSNNNLSVSRIKELIETQSERVNIATLFFIVGMIIILIGISVSLEMVSIGVVIILYALGEIINGNSLKSRFKKMLPEYVLPPEIECLKCGNNLELDFEERLSGKYFCPMCNQSFRPTIDLE